MRWSVSSIRASRPRHRSQATEPFLMRHRARRRGSRNTALVPEAWVAFGFSVCLSKSVAFDNSTIFTLNSNHSFLDLYLQTYPCLCQILTINSQNNLHSGSRSRCRGTIRPNCLSLTFGLNCIKISDASHTSNALFLTDKAILLVPTLSSNPTKCVVPKLVWFTPNYKFTNLSHLVWLSCVLFNVSLQLKFTTG